MAHLERPDPHVHTSFLAAMAQFQDEGRGGDDDNSMIGTEIRTYRDVWDTPEGFERFTAELCAQALPETARPRGHVPSTTYWWVEGDEYLGRIVVRHTLTPGLLDLGGHIGYDVPPSARLRGHASAMLRAILPLCADLGLDRVLVTCDGANTGSRKVIAAAQGVFEDERPNGSLPPKLRFWVPTGGGVPGAAAAQVARAERGRISPYHADLPIGRPIEARTDLRAWDVFPYESPDPLTVRILQEPVFPEPARAGEPGGRECAACEKPDERYLWADEHWRLTSTLEPGGAPALVLLEPRGHHDLGDLPAERAAELGPMLIRVERALLGLGGIARVHVNRWGDGAAHLHWWFFARPAGMLQFRGNMFALWDDVLPPIDAELWRANLNRIAAAMAADGGVAYPG